MLKKLFDNEYGFSVKDNNPFFIFPYLQKKAKQKYSDNEIYDLSRGDPGLGFSPAQESRLFFGFLSAIDTVLNSNYTHFRIHHQGDDNLPKVKAMIKECALSNFQTNIAEKHLHTLDKIIADIQKEAQIEGKNLSELTIIKGIFKLSTLFGGTYHNPIGEDIVKIVVAGMYRKFLRNNHIKSDDLIFTLGVNDAIGTLFKMLGYDGLGFIKAGDTVAASTPAYAPYFNELNARELNVLEISTNTLTGETYLETLEKTTERIKAFFLITPNNPTGIKYSLADIKKIANLAEKHNALIITDEIYSQFYPSEEFDTVWTHAEKRTIRLCGRSKIERSPGLRFGDALITDTTNNFLTKELLAGLLTAPDFKTQFVWAKGPGGNFASFQHTATVPGSSQIMGMLNILLGEEERAMYIKAVEKNMNEFFNIIGIPRNGKMYYGIFDLNDVPNNTKTHLGVDQKLDELCINHGVILIPAMKFFSPKEQAESDKSNFVRVSLPNLSLEEVKEAASRIKQYLTS